MSGKRRRGSSTRKYPIAGPKVKPVDKSLGKEERAIRELELEIRNGRKGKPLTEQEITKLKVRIANLEHNLGIKRD